VLTEDDPLYRGVRLPVYFWKIAAMAKEDGTLIVSAYLLDQKELIDGLERFNADTFQVSIEEIQARTGLDFAYLSASQVNLDSAPGLEREDGMPRKALNRVSDITL
jgi:endonuclease G